MALGGASPYTVRCRVGALRRLERDGGTPLLEADRMTIAAWLASFSHASTRSTNLSYVRCFYAWAYSEALIHDDPTRRLPKVKVPKAVPRPVPTTELEAMLGLAGARERLWVELMAYAGLRVSEVALCRPEHVWQAVDGAWWLRIPRGKGGHEQQVPLPAWLADEMRKAAPWGVGNQAVYRQVHKLLAAVGSTSTPHALRHWYATAALRQTGNLRTVQQMMRHASPATTARYTLVTSDEVVQAAEGLPRFGGELSA
jgi:site-specific recombinase XerD